jgi:hypothetical protein
MRQPVYFFASASLLISGCATTPDVTVQYFHPKLDARLRVTETVSCTKDNQIIAAATPAWTSAYSASRYAAAPVHLKQLGGPLADAAMTFTFTSDGRLLTVNESTTGHGQEVLDSAIKILTTVVASGAVGFDKSGLPDKHLKPTPAKIACDKIRALGDNKPITVAFDGPLNLERSAPPEHGKIPPPPTTPQNIPADLSTSPFYGDIAQAIGGICVRLEPVDGPLAYPVTAGGTYAATLELVQPALLKATTFVAVYGGCEPMAARTQVSMDELRVPQFGSVYDVPIPHAAMFGKQTFGLELSDAGTITKLQYDKETGAPQVMGVLNQAADSYAGLPAQETARMQAERARIAEQEKYVACIADSTKCGN